VQWTANPPEQGVSGYKIWRNKTGGADLIGTVPSTQLQFNTTLYLVGKRTMFCISAVNQNGESVRSVTVMVRKR